VSTPPKTLESAAVPLPSTVATVRESLVRFTVSLGGKGSALVRQAAPYTSPKATRMKTRMKPVHATIAGALLALAGCATAPQITTAWEYRIVEGWTQQAELAELEKELNEAGRKGYVIVSSTTMPADPNTYPKTIVILKRPIR